MDVNETSFKAVYNFIVNFTPEEIDEIIKDFHNHFKGKEILYAIDTYDIIAHYLPYTEKSFFAASNKNELANKIICYDYFFNSATPKNILILEEYKLELLSAKNRIQKQLKDSKNIVKTLEVLKEDTAVFTRRDPSADEYFEKNFEILLLLLILSEKKDFIHTEFENFLKNKIILDDVLLEGNSNSIIISEIFKNTGYSELSKELFQKYVDKNKYDLIAIEIPQERYVYLENTYRDIQAIDRIINLNEKLSIGSNCLITYLSSTPTKTKKIFDCLKDMDRMTISESYRYEAPLIHRNIFQCFLFDILKSEFEANKEEIFEALKSLKKLSIKLSSKVGAEMAIDNNPEPTDLPLLERLKNIFEIYSSDLDNHFYIKIYEKYKGLYETVKPERDKRKIERSSSKVEGIDILSLFALIDDFINKENFKSKLSDFNYTLNQIKQTVDLKNIFFSDQQFYPNVFFGRDIIKNNFQHLPYLIFFNSDIDVNLTDSLTELLNELTNITHSDDSSVTSLNPYLKNVIAEFSDQGRSIHIQNLQQIVLCYLNLLIVPVNSPKYNSEKEIEIIGTLEKQNQIFSSIYFDTIMEESADKKNLVMNFRPNIFEKEINYLLIWLYRRNNKIQEGIDLAESLINQYPDDPRFCHGLGLCLLSKGYEFIFGSANSEDKITSIKNDFDSAIYFLKKAVVLYLDKLELNFNPNFNHLLVKSVLAIFNSLADVSIRTYIILDKENLYQLTQARVYFDELVRFSKKYKVKYQQNNTFVATEIEIEYFEAYLLFELGNKFDSIIKIRSAQKKMNLLNEKRSYNNTHIKFLEVESNLNQLAERIFKN